MQSLISLIILALIIFGVYWLYTEFFTQQREVEEESPKLPFQAKPFLMNPPERKFFEELRKQLPESYEVFPQVVLSSIVVPKTTKEEYRKYRNMINRRILDYVVFEQPYYKPVLAIEYDGATHQRADRKKRDERVDAILASAGIAIVHVQHQKKISFEDIKKNL